MTDVKQFERAIVVLAALVFGIGAAIAADKPAAAPAPPRTILGRIEYAVVRDAHLKFKARIDTGAGISSLNAKILEVNKTADGERVRFQIDDGQGHVKTLERDVVGWAQIKVMGTDEKNRRPIVKLSVCVGGKRLKGRVNLTDRSEFLYPLLIGRNLLNTGKFLVDPSATYLQEPGCK